MQEQERQHLLEDPTSGSTEAEQTQAARPADVQATIKRWYKETEFLQKGMTEERARSKADSGSFGIACSTLTIFAFISAVSSSISCANCLVTTGFNWIIFLLSGACTGYKFRDFLKPEPPSSYKSASRV